MRPHRRSLRVLAGLAATVVVLPLLAAGGLAWRLSQGPLDVTTLARLGGERFVPGLAFDRVTLAWQGPDLLIAADTVRSGGDGPTAENLAASIEAAPLLHGALRLRMFSIDGLRMHLVRAPDDTLSVQGLTPSTNSGASSFDPVAALQRLDHVRVQHATLMLTEGAAASTGEIRDINADLAKDPEGGLHGHAEATMIAGDVTSAVTFDAVRPPGDTLSQVHVTVAELNPAVLSRLLPALAPLAALDVPLSVGADIALTAGLRLHHVALHAESGPGRAFLPAKGGGTSPEPFAALSLDAAGDLHAITLGGLRIVLAPPSGAPPSTITVTGDLNRTVDHAQANLHIALDRAQMADLGALWPAGVGGGARAWLVENVPAGAAHDGAFDLKLEAGAALDDLAVTDATGTLLADDVTLYWLRPVPPLEFSRVTLTVLDPDTLTIVPAGMRLGTLIGRQVSMRIWGLTVKDQFSLIEGDIAAPVADVFTLLQHPRLKLLSAHPLPVATPTGQSLTHLTVKLPLEHKVTMADIGIEAAAHLTDLRIAHLVAGRPLDQGVFDADINQDGLSLNGKARIAGIGSALTVDMDFRGGPPSQQVQHVTLAATADDKALATAGLDTIGLLAGSVSGKLDYAEQRDGHAVLQGSADLGGARLSTPLGWSKAAGPPASIQARAELNHGRLAGFDNLRADGPGLSVRGSSETVDGWPSILHIERCMIGRTSLTGTVTFPSQPGGALKVAVAGPQLDLAGPLSSKTTFEPSTPASVPPGRPYQVDIQFERVLMRDKGDGIGPVALTASGDERRIAQAHLASRGPEKLDVRIEPHGDTRRLNATVGDFGQLLQRLGSGLDVAHGALVVEGECDDGRAGSPLAATATLTNFGVRGAPVIGKVLQAMTLYGLVDALRGPGLVFDQLIMPFTVVQSVLGLHDVRAFSSSLGLTTQGQVDFGRGMTDLTGTIVPAYFFNTLLGRVPLVGRLFSPERGGGVFAATFALQGPTADPKVSVNPLATLTPGALRGLFG